ncbi:LEAF RUST 10 DISEASE-RESISTANCEUS RECEPTOR-LIKE PROTEIN KINASE-like 2.7 [Euphorbia lathyris]|uniref:LEAF RUST 10 DISEASE-RESISTANCEUS RECEPTOR-LIKE PROTEIN KINASE-like 2.7 n=1 Tax=Euphorbia lathyris TaxID=212925 RepID=UPI0033143981
MIRRRLLLAGHTAFLFLLFLTTCNGRDCPPASCGNLRNISYPFRLLTDPKECGDQRYTLSCESSSTVLYLYSGKYYVQEINYVNFTIRLVDAGIDEHDCFTAPQFPLTKYNFSTEDPYSWYKYKWIDSEYQPRLSKLIIFINCVYPVNSSLYVDTASCNNNLKRHSYVNIEGMRATDLMNMCSIEMMTMLSADKDYKNMTFVEIHRELAYGFELSWHNINCGSCISCFLDGNRDYVQCIRGRRKLCYLLFFGIHCYLTSDNPSMMNIFFHITVSLLIIIFTYIGKFLQIMNLEIYFRNIGSCSLTYISQAGTFCVAKTLCGTPIVTALLVYKWRRRHLSGYQAIENFLQTQNSLMPIRYSYWEIKKMSAGFKEKIGEGGFGTVFKGKLRSGHIAAIKMLDKSKTHGQDFINEVATIGRIHHTNIVNLIGFCVEGSKHALIYEFMSNGSLNRYISGRQECASLSWEKLYEISLGVARGIQYLHQGCNMQILHFDIKPHNILLDKNFTPKISDFGLAKFYPTRGSIASLTAARGTIGYMAPELFYKNIGRVSYKADVYSFGMLLLEMAGKRTNVNKLREKSSEAYFPYWVHDEVSGGEFVAAGDSTENSNEIAKKMVVVGLWCIQMKPNDRPAMNKVIQMLEGDLESLQLPPRPVLYPQETLVKDIGKEVSSLSPTFSESISSLTE